jgi:hypothetical protein
MTLLMLKFLPVQHLGYWLYDDDHWHVDFDHAAFVCDSWDTDLDLDLLLEEYTEYDPSDSGSDDYDCSTAKKKKTNTSATQPSTLTQYKCPVCAKKLK